jgi:hypothetical protein
MSFELCNLDGSGTTRENGRKNAKLNGHKSDVSVNPASSIQINLQEIATRLEQSDDSYPG